MRLLNVGMRRRARFHRQRPAPGWLLILGCACGLQLVSHPTGSQDFENFTVHELTLGGSQCAVEAINDGRAVGWATTPGDAEVHAFLWTEAGGMMDLGTLGGDRAEARAVDGDRVVGFSSTTSSEFHAFVWTPAAGMRDLGTLGGEFSSAEGVSGGQVVGDSTTASGDIHAFRWTAEDGMVDLGTLADGTESSAVAVHRGLVAGWSETHGNNGNSRRPVAWHGGGKIVDIVGEPFDILEFNIVRGMGESSDVRDGMVVGNFRTSGPNLEEHAFAWTAARGKIDLGTLPGDDVSFALATSGRQVVGFSSRFLERAFSWTASGGMIDLGTLGGDARATDVNNGKVVGHFIGPNGARAFLWTPETGMIDVTPPDFGLAVAVGIDEAGRIAVGRLEGDIGFARSAVLVFDQE